MHEPAAVSAALKSSPVAARLRGLAAALGLLLEAERERWVLWLPVAIGLGVALYFVPAREPPFWPAPCLLVAALAAARLGWRSDVLRVAALGLAGLAAGFAAASLDARLSATPMLQAETGPVTIGGRVVSADGRRIVVDRLWIGGLAAVETPRRVRVSLRPQMTAPAVGEMVRLRAILLPTPGPVVPGGEDFARRAFFQGIGASGFALGAPRPVVGAGPPQPGPRAWLRGIVAGRIAAALPQPAAGVATTLMTGLRAGLDPGVVADFRATGLSHLLAIAGLHVGLVAAIVVWAVRRSLALIERIALRWPIKKWAAVAGLLAALAYTLVCAPAIPTERATIMIAIALLALLVERDPFSMRAVAAAATALLLVEPDALLGASFQMSFAAVVALIAVYEGPGGRLGRWLGASRPGRLLRPLLLAALTSAVAGLATAPYAAFHFNQIAFYGILANALAVPIMALWVMPWALVAFAAMPLGLEGLPLKAMALGIDAILAAAHWVARLPGAMMLVKSMPLDALVVVSAGGLWLALWRGRWRAWGLVGVACGLVLAVLTPRPDVLVSADGRLVAVRQGDGALAVNRPRTLRFIQSIWAERDGAADLPVWPAAGPSGGCAVTACRYEAGGHRVAIVAAPVGRRGAGPQPVRCDGAEIIIAAGTAAPACPGALVIGRARLQQDGGEALYLSGGVAHVVPVVPARVGRPWLAAAP